MAKTSDALKIIDGITGKSTKARRLLAKARLNAQVAQMIYDARTQAGITQKELATLVGTTQSVIARLEDADYEGHSLSMLHRIAAALHRPLNIRMGRPRRRLQLA